MRSEDEAVSKVARGIRLDLGIAVCALLISTLAAGASWWQARVLQAQTQVLQQQLGAQVWPYVSVTGGTNNDTISVTIDNDGLGPAILRSFTATVDGVQQSSYLGLLHAVLGPHLIARSPHGDRFRFTIDSGSPGTVVRPGDNKLGFSLTSKRFAPQFLASYRRLSFRICYCAIIPGKCWLFDSRKTGGPQSLQSCPEIAKDLLHAPVLSEISARNF
jgi:hypothetical protein